VIERLVTRSFTIDKAEYLVEYTDIESRTA
jgi:hypothetical protein